MSSKESLIMQLYNEAVGPQQKDETRHVKSTNTLLDHSIKEEAGVKSLEIKEIPLDEEEYKEAAERTRNVAVAGRASILPGDTIRLVETRNFAPTGKTITTTVKNVIIGTTDNGVMSGKMVVTWQDMVW